MRRPAMAKTVARFAGADGVIYVSIVVGKSRPFAAAVLKGWSGLDGIDRTHMLRFKSFAVPASIFDEVAGAARAAVAAPKVRP